MHIICKMGISGASIVAFPRRLKLEEIKVVTGGYSFDQGVTPCEPDIPNKPPTTA